MSGTQIAKVTYLSDPKSMPNPKMPSGEVNVALIAYPDYLVIQRSSDGQNLETIPWANIVDISMGIVNKRGKSALFTSLVWVAGFGKVTHMGDPYHKGVTIDYKDVEHQRNMRLFFKSSGGRREHLLRELWHYRDQYTRGVGRIGQP